MAGGKGRGRGRGGGTASRGRLTGEEQAELLKLLVQGVGQEVTLEIITCASSLQKRGGRGEVAVAVVEMPLIMTVPMIKMPQAAVVMVQLTLGQVGGQQLHITTNYVNI